MAKPAKGRTRVAEVTRARILAAAKTEFARKGLGGARVDAIAARSKANKRMIYHYFGSKDRLFTAVLEEAYRDIRSAELALPLDTLEPESAIETLLRFTWDYYLANPEFVTLVNSANLHQARHLKNSEVFRGFGPPFVGLMKSILDRGVEQGVFRSGIDPVQLNITMAAIGYYYLTNRHTGTIMFARDYMTKKALDERFAFNRDTIMRLIKTKP
ncbi:MAG: TetR/AcrR family transcriptional regulator [Parvibaculaceae bacterium]